MANPAHKPTKETRQKVRDLLMAGLTQERVAKHIGVSVPTLEKYYSREIETASETAVAAVAKTAYDMAISGESPAMTMFYLKTRGGWRETDRHEITGANGGPIDLRALTDTQLAQIAAGDEGDTPELPEGVDGDTDADAEA